MLAAPVLAPSGAEAAAPPPPELVSPANGRDFPPPAPRDVTFVVDGQVDESPGSLHIQFSDADVEVADDGSYQHESGVDDYVLEQVEPGGNRYSVTVPAEAFGRYGSSNFYWQAYRVLSEPDCSAIANSSRRDCVQESDQRREFELLDPPGYGNYEPNNSPATATPRLEYSNQDCAYLEERTDVDWYRFDGRTKAFGLRLRLHNDADSDRWVPLRSRRKESADMRVTVYRAKGLRKVASKHVRVGKSGVLKTRLRAKTAYLFAFRHAGNGFPKARPARDMSYRFEANLGGQFADAQGCV
ncbi:MAG TPA: hypothetical protein VF606_07615 [Geminicoccaceae bacterium]